MRWNLWVVGYSFRRQRQLLSSIGIRGTPWKVIFIGVAIIFASVALGLALFWGTRIRSGPVETEKVQKYYSQFCKKLARAGIARRPEQGPVDYARQVIKKRKDLADRVQTITALYVRLRYGRDRNEADVTRLRSLVKSFRPPRKNSVLFSHK